MSIAFYALIAAVVLAIIFIKMTVVIIPQSETKIIERLGKYFATLKPGINIIIPFIDRSKAMVSMSNGRYIYTNNSALLRESAPSLSSFSRGRSSSAQLVIVSFSTSLFVECFFVCAEFIFSSYATFPP